MRSVNNPRKRASAAMLALALACVMASTVQAQQLQPDGINDTTNDSDPIKYATGPPLSYSEGTAAVDATTDAASAAVTVASAVEPQAAVPKQMAAILNQHNKYRAQHGAGPLTWNTGLGNAAANWARKCNLVHSQANGYGENLYLTSVRGAGAIAGALSDAIRGWYGEVRDYNFQNPGFSMATGHFTQVVWKSSTQLGCGVQDCPTVGSVTGFNGGTMVVCRYKPPGNWDGRYRQNVLPARRSGNGGGNANANVAADSNLTPFNSIPSFNPSSAITSEKGLQSGQCINSRNGKYRLCVTKTGLIRVQNSVGAGQWKRTWSNGMAGPSNGAKPFILGLEASGNLVVKDSQNIKYWETTTSGTAPFALVLRDNGNLMLYDSTGSCLWSIKGNCAQGKKDTTTQG